MEVVIRTVKVKLDVPDERCDDLQQTKTQFLHCANTTADWAWRHPDDHCVTSKHEAEQALYERLRSETELTANLVQKGIHRAVEATKSGVARLKNGDTTSQPQFDAWSVVYDKRSATFHREPTPRLAALHAHRTLHDPTRDSTVKNIPDADADSNRTPNRPEG